MTKRALTPAAFGDAATQFKFSAGVVSGDHVFLTGMTGSAADGTMPGELRQQFSNVWDKIALVLAEANLGLDAIVEMTSYHVGLRDHFDLFDTVRLERLSLPYPAWTAVEVAGLRREGAAVEIRVIASLGQTSQ